MLYTSDRQHPLHSHDEYLLVFIQMLNPLRQGWSAAHGSERSEQPGAEDQPWRKGRLVCPCSGLQVLRP